MLQISKVVEKVLTTTAAVAEWGEEAGRVGRSEDHLYGLPDESLELQPPHAPGEPDPWQVEPHGQHTEYTMHQVRSI